MVTSIARQSVIIKCNMQKSVLTGNYEFYYAAGLIAKLSGVEISDDIKPIVDEAAFITAYAALGLPGKVEKAKGVP